MPGIASSSAAACLQPAAARDPDVLTVDVAHARLLGFTAKLCIHPAQLPAVADGFDPSAQELRWARAVLDAAGRASRRVRTADVLLDPTRRCRCLAAASPVGAVGIP
ncbi:hypothetical protein [Streptomyces dysideae]|nr:hypothetical protein [Streptomyces dysideae]